MHNKIQQDKAKTATSACVVALALCGVVGKKPVWQSMIAEG